MCHFQLSLNFFLQLCKHEIMSASISAAQALSKYLNLETGTYSVPATYTSNEEETFFLCLERIYRLGMKRPNFRVRNVLSFLCQSFYLLFSFQHLSLFPTITTGSSDDLLSDTPVTLDAFGVNCSSNPSSETSGLIPHVSLFEGTYSDGSNDLELNTEYGLVAPPDSYQNNNAPEESLDHLTNCTPFGAKWAKLSDQDSCDNIDLSEVGFYGTFEKRPSNEDDNFKHGPSDLAMDLDIDYFPEESDGGWQWSPDSLPCDQDSLGKISSHWASSLAPPLKMLNSLNSTTAIEDILDPLHVGYKFGLTHFESDRKHNPHVLANPCIIPYERPALRSLEKADDTIQVCSVQEGSSGDHYLERESDMHIHLLPHSKPVITDDDHEIMAFDFSPNSSQTSNSRSGILVLFSDQHPGQPMCGCEEGPTVGGDDSGVRIDDDYHFLAIEYDSDVSA